MSRCSTGNCDGLRAVRHGCGIQGAVVEPKLQSRVNKQSPVKNTKHTGLDLASSATFHPTQMPPIKEEEEDELDHSTSEDGEAYVDEEYTLSGTLEPGNPTRWACSALFRTYHTTYLVTQKRLTVCRYNRGP
jgi:hypothetical protein